MPKLTSFSSILNDLFQRGHLPEPSFEYKYLKNSHIHLCKVSITNEIGITQSAYSYAKTKRYAKQECSFKLIRQVLQIFWRKYFSLKRIKFHLIHPNWRSLTNLVQSCHLERFQVYLNTVSDHIHICLPEVDLHVSSEDWGEVAYLMLKELKRYYERQRSRGALLPVFRIINIIPPEYRDINVHYFEHCILEMYRNFN